MGKSLACSNQLLSFRLFLFATGAGRDGIAVRAGLGMAEEGADALVEFGRDDVFGATGLLMGFGVCNGECIREQSLGQTVATNDVARAASARFGKADFAAVVGGTSLPVAAPVKRGREFHQARIRHPRQQPRRT